MDTKYIVKITVYKSLTLADEVVYYRSNLSLDFVNNWKWYFEYLAALVKVYNPYRPVKTVICQQDLLIGKEYISQKSITLLRAKKSRLKKLQSTTSESDLFGADQRKRDEKTLLLQDEIEALERGEFNYWYPVDYINKVKKWTSNKPKINQIK